MDCALRGTQLIVGSTRMLLIFVIALSCGRVQEGRPIVPALAPDSIPGFLYDEENLVRDTTGRGNAFMRGIVVVRFRQGATVRERQQAIDAVNGVVVGGKAVDDGEGFYLVRIPHDPDPGQSLMFAAIARLKAMAQVQVASINWVIAVPGSLGF